MKYLLAGLMSLSLLVGVSAQPKPAAPDTEIADAIKLIQSNQFPQAESGLRQLARKYPRNADVIFLLGTVLLQTNRTDEGINRLESVLQIKPNHIQANYNLALIYSSRSEYQKAIPLLEKAVGITAKNKTPQTDDNALLIALIRAYRIEKRTAEADKITALIENKNSQDVRVLFTLGLTLADLGDYERAISIFDKTNTLRPQTYEILYNLGIAYYNSNKSEQAKKTFNEAIAVNAAQPEPYYRIGLIYSAENDSDAAVSYWLKAIELKPDYHEANFFIGEELLKRRKFAGALPFYQKAVEMQPEKLLYQLRLGVNYFRLQQYGDARKVFDLISKTHPDDFNINFLKAYTSRAEGFFEESAKSFEKLLTTNPDNPDVLANLGYLMLERGQLDKAEQFLRKSISFDDKNFTAYYDLGRLLNRQKKYAESVEILERGAALKADDPGMRYQLFIAFTRLKQKEKADNALAEFKRLEKIFSNGTPASKNDQVRDLPDSVDKIKP